MKPHANFATTNQAVPPVVGVQPSATLADANLPTEEQLKEAYHQLMLAERAHTKRGLEFGRMCHQLQQHHRRQGVAGEGFEALMTKLNITKTTAYRWIRKYKECELSATWHEVEKKRKANKEKVTSDGHNVQLEFDLPTDYPREQWNADVKALGGPQKVRKLFLEEFLPLLHKKAEEKRHTKEHTGSLQ